MSAHTKMKYIYIYSNYSNVYSNLFFIMERENDTYECGDIVCFLMWKRQYTGKIKQMGYYVTIELLTDLTIAESLCEYKFKYRPHGIDKWYQHIGYDDEIKENVVKVLFVSVEERKIQFSIKREDKERYLQAKTEGEKFKLLLRGFWKNFVVRKVKTVVLPAKELGICKYQIDTKYAMVKSDHLHGKNGKTFEERWNGVDLTETADTFYMKYYSSYYGFTSKFGNNDQEIFFSMNNYHELDLDINHTAWFSNWGNHTGGHQPPMRGHFVCGIVDNEKGLYYDKWFTCSPQFFNFWKFIMSDNKVRPGTYTNRLLESVKPFSYDSHLTEDQRKEKLELYKAIAKNGKCYATDACYYEHFIKYILTGEKACEGSNARDVVRNFGRY